MTIAELDNSAKSPNETFFTWGMFWLAVTVGASGIFFIDGFDALLTAWQKPEYSHGPLIPMLSALLFLRQLKEYPANPGYLRDRWPGVIVVIVSIALGAVGKLANIPDIIAYAMILWIGGILLISFGWRVGLCFWPPVLHLVYMLPLPDVLYYKMSTYLQYISSELGVWFLRLMNVPVYLEGNIIDLGVLKLHVAEACSGLRYLFPILSFSYIFAVLYRGPMWHKAVLLVSAAPITILMNSVRIAIGGVLVQQLGVEWLEGFTHFFEGWVIFLSCIMILFALARIMLMFQRKPMTLVEALDLETDGLGQQALRIRLVQPSMALITAASLMIVSSLAWQAVPERGNTLPERDIFAIFPRDLDNGTWQQVGQPQTLEASVVKALKADDYHSVNYSRDPSEPTVGFFTAWYRDQSDGGVHSPEICLPGSGWEIAWLERVNIADQLGSDAPFNINRAIIQKGETKMMVYYWFEQKGRKIAHDFTAKLYLMRDGVTTGRMDGAIVRLTTLISDQETDADAAARLDDILFDLQPHLPRFIPGS